ncbi:DNA pilot protein [Tortoise microvirus 67]|nr:DNA pilot protein [Tortoise microvirus 67]
MLNFLGSLGMGFVNGFFQQQQNEQNLAAQKEANEQNLAFQEKWNTQQQSNWNKSFALQQDTLDYNKALNAEQMAREDTSFQRRVEDVTAAGFSPLAALGQSAHSGGSVISQPSNPTTSPQGAHLNAYAGMAPNIDTGSVLDAAALALEDKRITMEYGDRAKQREHELNLQARESAAAMDRLSKQLLSQSEIAGAQIQGSKDVAGMQIEGQKEIASARLAQDLEIFGQELMTRNYELIQEQIKAMTGSYAPYDIYYDKEEYDKAYNKYYQAVDFITLSTSKDLTRLSKSFQGSVSPSLSLGGSVAGVSANVSGSLGASHGGSDYKDPTEFGTRRFKTQIQRLRVPVWHEDLPPVKRSFK